MKTIFFFFWNLIMGIKMATIKLLDKDTTFVLFYSILASMTGKESVATALQKGQRQPYNKLQPSVFYQKDQQIHLRAEWRIWCENDRILILSSA